MALKYALNKLIFLERVFEFMINTAPPTSNSVHGRDKCFKYKTATSVVKDLNSRMGVSEGVSSYPSKLSHSFKRCKFFSF